MATAALATADMERASSREQKAAHDLIQAIMAHDVRHSDVALLDIRGRASNLSTAALEVVGRVLGIGGAAECSHMMECLNAQTLVRMQEQLGCMGMEHRPGQ